MKKLTASLAALLVAACSTETDPAQKYRDALPKAQAVQLGTPQSDGLPAGALSVARQPLGDTSSPQSEYATMSYYLALSMNGGVVWTLAIVKFVTAFPPTTCDDASCTWGPWIDDQGLNRYELVVTKQGAAYGWALAAQPGSDPAAAFVNVIAGTAYPVDSDHGSGTFTIDFDAQDALDHGSLWQKEDYGQLVVNYDNTRNPTIGATFLGAYDKDPANPHFVNAAYSFEAAVSGGQLQIAAENLDTTEIITLRTRWSAGGAGRSDAHYTGAGGSPNYFASECWAGRALDFAEVYDSKFPGIPALSDESMCLPFVPAQYADIALPQ